jgi:diguanylate cyclase (GGDEF)-like protein
MSPGSVLSPDDRAGPQCSLVAIGPPAQCQGARRQREVTEVDWRALPGATHPEAPAPLPGDDETLILLEWPARSLLIETSRIIAIEGPAAAHRRIATDEARSLLGEQRRRQLREDRLSAMIGYVDALNRAVKRTQVHDILRQHVLNLVEAFAAVILEHDAEKGGWRASQESSLLPIGFRIPAVSRFGKMGVISPSELQQMRALAPLRTLTDARMLLHVPIGSDAVLLLVERRTERIPDYEEWELLRAISNQADATLERVRLFEEVRLLSLTDPLTGLANRRQMDVAFERVISAAARGEPLSVVMIDLDHFKQVNDTLGHQAGDRLLKKVADAMREVARGSDLVVRYGGDEFMLILPGTRSPSTVVQRLRERLGKEVQFTEGIAQWGPETETAEALVAAADAALYAARARMRGHSASAEIRSSGHVDHR